MMVRDCDLVEAGPEVGGGNQEDRKPGSGAGPISWTPRPLARAGSWLPPFLGSSDPRGPTALAAAALLMACLGLVWPGCINGKCEDRENVDCPETLHNKYDCDACATVWMCVPDGDVEGRYYWYRSNYSCECVGSDGSYLYYDSADPSTSSECASTEGR